ncbi:uncharacterized protein G2W53_029836 [Senna tora]|uniref:Uncharacterized protein n=1 Tax=Senna tora TaxID=362788 RepID=A0A834T8B0_9FABA|nr:uncharacterized protein G2W53_029836 [Senna tora]
MGYAFIIVYTKGTGAGNRNASL